MINEKWHRNSYLPKEKWIERNLKKKKQNKKKQKREKITDDRAHPDLVTQRLNAENRKKCKKVVWKKN